MKKVGLSVFSILLFLVFLVTGIVLYSFLVGIIIKIPLITFIANLFHKDLLYNALNIVGVVLVFVGVLNVIEKIIDRIDNDCTEACMLVVGIFSSIVFLISVITNIVFFFTGNVQWATLIVSIVILFMSFKLIKDSL